MMSASRFCPGITNKKRLRLCRGRLLRGYGGRGKEAKEKCRKGKRGNKARPRAAVEAASERAPKAEHILFAARVARRASSEPRHNVQTEKEREPRLAAPRQTHAERLWPRTKQNPNNPKNDGETHHTCQTPSIICAQYHVMS